ncbi:MAG: ferredoxin [Verrucomicrobiota bacterium]|nr:ferredoxin [Verrucomicrobiota bacterium]
MANREEITPGNVSGKYYVDESCIDCDLCRTTAPEFFRRNDAGGFSYVHLQPTTPEERALADEALLGCPTDSIGNDGVLASEPALEKD